MIDDTLCDTRVARGAIVLGQGTWSPGFAHPEAAPHRARSAFAFAYFAFGKRRMDQRRVMSHVLMGFVFAI